MAVNSGDILRVDLLGDFDGDDDIFNSFQLRVAGGGSFAEADVLTDIESWGEDLLALIRVFLTFISVFRGLRVFNKTQGLLMDPITFSPPISGTLAGESYAPGVAALFTFPTRYPRVVGRKFFGVLAEPAVGSLGTLSSVVTDAAPGIITHLTQQYTGATVGLIYGYDSPKAGQFVDFTEGLVRTEPAYQRRRRRGSGS